MLLHAVSAVSWPRELAGAMEALARARAAGKVRAVGISVHSLEALGAAVVEPWVEILLARLNHAGTNMDASPAVVVPPLEAARASGKGIIAMKVLGCGELASDVEGAVRFVAGAGCVHALTVGPTEECHLGEVAAAVEAHWGASPASPGCTGAGATGCRSGRSWTHR